MKSLRLAWGLLQGQRSRAWLFVFCIAVGVAARVSVGSFLASLDAGLGREARQLLTADLEITGSEPLSAARLQELEQVLPAQSRVSQRVSLLTMASAGGRSRLVQLGAVDEAYPLVGALTIEGPGSGDAAALQGRAGLYAQAELLAQLGLKIGDAVRLGRKSFKVVGILRQEPGLGAGAFSLGPRVLIGRAQLRGTGLTDQGARVSFETLAALEDPSLATALADELKRRWNIQAVRTFRGTAPPPGTLRLRTVREAQGEVRQFFERLADYLSLVSLMALLLGGVGVASVTRGFVREAAVSVGILRSLGAGPGSIRAVFAWQSLMLGLAGGVLGVAAGSLAQALLPSVLASFLPVSLESVFSAKTALWGLGLGAITALVFGLEPVLASGQQSTAALLRDEEPEGRTPWTAWVWRLVGALVFAALAALESRSWTRGPGVFGAILLGALLLQALGDWLLPRLAGLRRLPLGFAVRHGLANLGRPGLRAGASLVALGSAALLLGVLAVYQYSLLAELSPGRSRSEMPDLFLIDIQRDQVQGIRDYVATQGLKAELSPMVKARYRGKVGQAEAVKTQDWSRDKQDQEFMRSREQNLSWRPSLGPGETLSAGTWMDPDGEEAEVSLEERFAERLNAKLGDVLRLDVQGVEVQAKVTSLRKVHWASFQPNFFILVSPWAIEDAPQTWIGSIRGAGNAEKRGALQAQLVQRFANVTLFDVAEGTQKILGILDKIQGAVRLVAWFCLATGLVVLAGLALASARSRRGEAALLKVLGAGPRQLLGASLAEFGLLAALASMLGLGLSLAFGWVLLTQVLELQYAAPWRQMVALGTLFTATGAVVGGLASWQVYRAHPAEVLRED